MSKSQADRSSITAFCRTLDITKVQLAAVFCVSKQQIRSWEKQGHTIEHDKKAGKLDIIRIEKVIKSKKY